MYILIKLYECVCLWVDYSALYSVVCRPTTNNQLIIVEIVSRLSPEMETVSLIGAPNIKVDTDTAVATNVAVVGQIILLKVNIFS